MKDMHPAFVLTVRLGAVVLGALVLLYVLGRAVVPGGRLLLMTDFRTPAPFVSDPKPIGRLLYDEDDGIAIPVANTPLYVDLDAPSSFEKVDMRVRYRPAGHSMVELGALAAPIDGLFDVRPAESTLLDGLSWYRVSSGKLTLYQRTREYASVDEFLRNPPALERVASWHASTSDISAATVASSGFAKNISLRGSHRMYISTHEGTETIKLSVQDMNRQQGADPAILSVYRDGDDRALARAILDDDGNTKGDQGQSQLRNLSATFTGLEPGTYKVEFTTTDDVFIRRIESTSSRLLFADRLYLGDIVGYADRIPPVVVYGTGSELTVRTAHDSAFQTMTVDGRPLEIGAVGALHAIDMDGSVDAPSRIVAPQSDVLLETDGEFALSESASFVARPYGIEWHTTASQLDELGVDFVLTMYEQPVRSDDIRTATATFDFADLTTTEDGAYRFAVAAPGVTETLEPFALVDVTFVLRRDAPGWSEGFRRLFDSDDEGSGLRRVVPDGRSFGEHVP